MSIMPGKPARRRRAGAYRRDQARNSLQVRPRGRQDRRRSRLGDLPVIPAPTTHPAWCDPIACTFDRPGGYHIRAVGEIPRDATRSTGAAGKVTIGDSQVGGVPAEVNPLTWIEVHPLVFNFLDRDVSDPLQPGEMWALTVVQARQLALLLLDAIDLATPPGAGAR